MALAERVLARYEEAKNEKNQMTGVWDALKKYARPSRDNSGVSGAPGENASKSLDSFTRLHDSTLMNANIRHCGGVKAWMAPATSLFFSLEPPDGFENDEEIKKKCAEWTQTMHRYMAKSNFHTEDHEAILDGGAFGTRALVVEDAGLLSPHGPLNYQCWEIGSYAVLASSRGMIDTVFQHKEFTVRQAVQQFGEGNLPEALQQKYRDKPEDGTKHEFVWAIYPREDAERDKSVSYTHLTLPTNREV